MENFISLLWVSETDLTGGRALGQPGQAVDFEQQ